MKSGRRWKGCFSFFFQWQPNMDDTTPLWSKCEDETCTIESENLESSGTLETSELNCRGQNTSPWGVLYTVGKVLKCRCWKLAVWLPTTKSQESTRPRCVQVECNTPLESSRGELQVCFRPCLNQRSEPGVMSFQSPKSLIQDSFGTPPWESRD